MDGVLVLAATNMPWALDSAIRRRYDPRPPPLLTVLALTSASTSPSPTRGPGLRCLRSISATPLTPSPMRVRSLHSSVSSHPPLDFRQLGELTDNYSGSDIGIVVREALMYPVRIVQSATHFRRVRPPPSPLLLTSFSASPLTEMIPPSLGSI